MSGLIDVQRVRSALAGGPSRALERPRRAAVAVVLAGELGDLSLLLMRRSERIGDPWSGHMALPGGHQHASDLDLLQTALRETREEVGLDLASAELLGELDDIMPMRSSDIAVRPFVFGLREPPPLTLSDEVAETLWVPLAALSGSALRQSYEVEIHGARLTVPAFVIEERVVWGMTFRLLEDFLAKVSSA